VFGDCASANRSLTQPRAHRRAYDGILVALRQENGISGGNVAGVFLASKQRQGRSRQGSSRQNSAAASRNPARFKPMHPMELETEQAFPSMR
jgi:hypothetical protein